MKDPSNGQFDDTPLTLRELDLIRTSITRSLSAIYHGRIQYPDERPAATPESGGDRSAPGGPAVVGVGGQRVG